MGRLIDADILKVTKIVERKRKVFADGRVRKVNDWTDVVLLEDIRNAPTVDAVEVVRCKNCEYHISDVGIGCLCSYFGKYMRFEDFCSYGERRSDG